MTTITISMPDAMKTFIEQQVQSGEYGNTSEYIRELIRKAQDNGRAKELERLLLEGLRGKAVQATPEFWDKLKKETASHLAQARKKQKKGA